LKIADKYSMTESEKNELITVSLSIDAETAFEYQCSTLLVKAQLKAISEGKIKNTWNEVAITRHLKKHLRQIIGEIGVQYFVIPEYPEDDEEIDDGNKSPAEEVYFDLVFSSFSISKQFYFAVEAKIIIENNFRKRIATTEISEYISNKGMRKFIEGIYKKKGCMLGYVVEGNPAAIVKKINEKIRIDPFYKESAILEKKPLIEDFDCYYESTHSEYNNNPLRHLFLDFATKN